MKTNKLTKRPYLETSCHPTKSFSIALPDNTQKKTANIPEIAPDHIKTSVILIYLHNCMREEGIYMPFSNSI